MSFYSDIKHDLIGPKMKRTVYTIKTMKPASFLDNIGDFYQTYISPNLLSITIIILIILFLMYRYNNKQTDITVDDDSNIIEELRFVNEQPSFNPTQPIPEDQQNDDYDPDPMPIKLPNEPTSWRKSIYTPSKSFEPLNKDADYDYTLPYRAPRDYYTGTYNPYQNYSDTTIGNTQGFPHHFNRDMSNFITPMTQANMQNMYDYQSIVTNTQNNLINNIDDAGVSGYDSLSSNAFQSILDN